MRVNLPLRKPDLSDPVHLEQMRALPAHRLLQCLTDAISRGKRGRSLLRLSYRKMRWQDLLASFERKL